VDAPRGRYGIEGSSYWPPCHLEPFYQRELAYRAGVFPVAETVLRRIVALPIFVGLTDGDVAVVCRGLADVLAEED
jgi:dTDP-4-amino-4,6-dideoxygalactose transaminase